MARITGIYKVTKIGEEQVRAFRPYALPPQKPPLQIEGKLADLHGSAVAALGRLEVAGALAPSAEWFLYGFVRKEAVISSQIEGTQATLEDVLTFEATRRSDMPAEVEEVCNYVEALSFARKELTKPKGLPLCTRLLCKVHEHLMRGVRGAEKQPGVIRTSQNWVGGTRPSNASFVPPPPEDVVHLLSELEKWLNSNGTLPPLVRAGLAHVQFETIHPFLDGNGRVGRLLITLLLEHWGLLTSPLLYLSLAFKRHRKEYYNHLTDVRAKGDWENWISFFLTCVHEAADNAVSTAHRIFMLMGNDRHLISHQKSATIYSIRLLDKLVEHPIVTMPMVMELLKTTKPTALKIIDNLRQGGVLHEITGKRRDRVYAYQAYLKMLAEDTEIIQNSKQARQEKFTRALRETNQKYAHALKGMAKGR